MKGPFYTFRGYSLLKGTRELTPSMEDYLEMIARLTQKDGYTRSQELAVALHVKPPSVSRMIRRLADKGYVKYERYDIIRLTAEGEEIGRYLLGRHETLERFFRLLGLEDTLPDAEKVEHNLSDPALHRISCLVLFLTSNPAYARAWRDFLNKNSGEEPDQP